ncbi:MAG: TonB-dependent receptor [Acidobacteria bacterium]|nr:TonB-dependent receptor [Acidobacteriota bacterium]
MKRIVATVVLALGSVAALWSQVTSGSISGYVLDSSAGTVPKAEVSLVEVRNGIRRSMAADGGGHYQFSQLPPGVYTVSAKSDRFAESLVKDVAVTVDSRLRVDVTLAPAGMRSQVQVTASVRALQTESADLGAVIDRSRVEALPLNRRDFLQLALLIAGVLPPVEDSELSSRGSFAMHANGAREEFNNFLLDGVDNNDPDVNRYNLQPPVDAIQEFKIATNSYSAEYGRSAGGQVNVVTRSGGNAWHGFAYDYLRNRVLDGNNYFDPSGSNKYIRNQFGGGLGGPLRRDRTFVFGNFDGLRERQGLTRLGSVPVESIRRGDLSSLPGAIFDPFTRQPFANRQIPASRIAPLSSKVFALFPGANLPGAAANYLAQPTGQDQQNQVNLRGDHYASVRDILTFRYSFGNKSLVEPYAEDNTDLPGFGDSVKDRGHNALAQYQRVLGPRSVNVLLLGFNRLQRSILPENVNQDVNQLWGVNWLPKKPIDFGYPAITVAGYSKVGDVTQLPIDRAGNTYQLHDSLAVIRGAHALKLGFEARHNQHNGINDLLSRGSLSFSGALSGSGPSDLLLGLPSFGVQSQSDAVQTLRSTATNYYMQDDWKLRPNFTVNLGLRYEYNTPPKDPSNRMTVLDLATGQLSRVGQNGVSRSGTRPDRNNFAPRVGFAWSPGARTTVRGGYGVFFDSGLMVANTSLYFNPPYFNIRAFFPTAQSLLTLADPFPTRGGITPAASLSSLSPDLTQAYLQHWNFSIQHQLPQVGVLTVSYGASKGTHLTRSRDFNQPTPGAGDLARRRPLPAFNNIFLIESGGNSNFNSLQASLTRPVSRGLSMIVAYTYSKSIDDTSAFLGVKADKNFPQNSSNFGAERAASSFDVRQRASVSAVWQLPGRFLKGFQASTIVSGNTGQPLTPLLRFDNSNTGNTGGTYGNDRPNVVGDTNSGPRTPQQWFSTSAFSTPARYSFGNAGRNIIRGPGLFTADASLARRFQFKDRLVFQLEAQAFNLTNHTNFSIPQLFADEPASFGRIFSARSPRQVQVAGRFTF